MQGFWFAFCGMGETMRFSTLDNEIRSLLYFRVDNSRAHAYWSADHLEYLQPDCYIDSIQQASSISKGNTYVSKH